MGELPFMDNQLFEYFFVLAEILNYTKAADQLYKTESVLSRQISKLEFKLGVQLFDRTRKTVSLTPASSAFLNGLIRGNDELVILPISDLGYTQLGIIHDEKNSKACKTLFYNYVKEMKKSNNFGLF